MDRRNIYIIVAVVIVLAILGYALGWFGGRVDVYQVHNLVALRHWLPVLQDLRREGTVRAVGVTHYAHAAFADLARAMRAPHTTHILNLY